MIPRMSIWLYRTVSACLLVLLAACSTTNSDVREVWQETDRSSAKGTPIAIVGESIQTSSQEGGGLFTLHSEPETLLALTRVVARHYGFKIVEETEAEYVFELESVVPDGGACIEGVESAELGFSYTVSLLTLGAFPATGVHCLVVEANLYALRDGERDLMGAFESNAGSVEVFAGINELEVYHRTVKPEDERRGIEASLGALFSELINEGAFSF